MWTASTSWPLDQIPLLVPLVSCIQSPNSLLKSPKVQNTCGLLHSYDKSLIPPEISQIFLASSFLTFSRPPTWVSKSRQILPRAPSLIHVCRSDSPPPAFGSFSRWRRNLALDQHLDLLKIGTVSQLSAWPRAPPGAPHASQSKRGGIETCFHWGGHV